MEDNNRPCWDLNPEICVNRKEVFLSDELKTSALTELCDMGLFLRNTYLQINVNTTSGINTTNQKQKSKY